MHRHRDDYHKLTNFKPFSTRTVGAQAGGKVPAKPIKDASTKLVEPLQHPCSNPYGTLLPTLNRGGCPTRGRFPGVGLWRLKRLGLNLEAQQGLVRVVFPGPQT